MSLIDEPVVTAAGPSGDRPSVRTRKRPTLLAIAPHAIFLLVLLVTFVFAPGYRSENQIASLLQLMALLGVVAIGQNLAILIGGIDLSVGAILAVSIMVNAWLYRDVGVAFPIAALAGLLVGGDLPHGHDLAGLRKLKPQQLGDLVGILPELIEIPKPR